MPADSPVTCAEIFRRFCEGDDEAARWVLGRFEPMLLKVIEHWLSDRALQRRVDAEDVLQAALLKFYGWTKRRERRIKSLGDLGRLLISLCAHATRAAIEHHRAQCRDVERVAAVPVEIAAGNLPAPGRNSRRPGSIPRSVLKRLPNNIRELVDRRLAGETWVELAAQCGESADALRKRIERAVKRGRLKSKPK